MSIEWCRLWHDMPSDPKFRAVAKRSGRPTAEVLALFTAMLTNASGNEDERGTLRNWSHEDMGVALDIEPEHAEAIFNAMQGKLLDGHRLTGWERRQPKREDGSAERAKAWRERNRTHPNAEKRQYPDPYPEEDGTSDTLPSEQVAAREKSVEGLGLEGLGRGGVVSADARRKVAARLAIGNADPLVSLYESWPKSRKALDPDGLFIAVSEKLYREAKPEVKAACQPLAPLPPEPIPKPTARPSLSLLASLNKGKRYGVPAH